MRQAAVVERPRDHSEWAHMSEYDPWYEPSPCLKAPTSVAHMHTLLVRLGGPLELN